MRFGNFLGTCVLTLIFSFLELFPVTAGATGFGCGGVPGGTGCLDQAPQQGCTQYSPTTGACVSSGTASSGQGCTQYSATTGACVSSGTAAAGQQGCTQFSPTTGACVSGGSVATGATTGTTCVGVALQPGETCSNGVVSCQTGAGRCSTTPASAPAAQSQTCTTYSATTGACLSNTPSSTGSSALPAPAATAGVATVTVNTSFVASGGQVAQPPSGAAGSTFTLTPVQAGGAATTLTGNASGQAAGTVAPGSYTFQQTSPPRGANFLSASIAQSGAQAQSLAPGVATPFSAGVTYAISVVDQIAGQQSGGTATLSVFNTVTTVGGQPSTGSRSGYSLTLNAQNGTPVQTVVTNQLGQATFSNLQSGVYSLSETPPPGSTFVSMSINGDPAQLQQAFQLQAGGNYEADITHSSSSAGSGSASAGSTSGCPSSSIPESLEDRLWEQACPILPASVSSTSGSGTPASTTSTTGSGSGSSSAGSGAISVGELVQVTGTGNGLNVRTSPETSASIVTSLSDGTTATVVGGPQTGDGYTWWQLDAGGWSVGDYLSPASSQPAGN